MDGVIPWLQKSLVLLAVVVLGEEAVVVSGEEAVVVMMLFVVVVGVRVGVVWVVVILMILEKEVTWLIKGRAVGVANDND